MHSDSQKEKKTRGRGYHRASSSVGGESSPHLAKSMPPKNHQENTKRDLSKCIAVVAAGHGHKNYELGIISIPLKNTENVPLARTP